MPLDTLEAGTLELLDLEHALEGDLECQADHSKGENRVCSVEIVAFGWFCIAQRPGKPICGNTVDYIDALLSEGWLARCHHCHRQIRDCWGYRLV